MWMIVLAECSKNSLKRTRRILSRYLWQVGRRAWMGNISMEGMELLKTDLKKSSAKNSSIVAWRSSGRKGFELLFVIGHKARFDQRMLYSWASSKKNKSDSNQESEQLESPVTRIVYHILGLSSLFHDLGKGTPGFQRKLMASLPSELSDPVRHEVISCRMLQIAIQENKATLSWLDSLSDKTEALEFFNSLNNSILIEEKNGFPELEKPWQQYKDLLFLQENTTEPLDQVIWNSIQWLVLSHHRLPWSQPGFSEEHRSGISNLHKFDVSITEGNKEIWLNNFERLKKDFRTIVDQDQPWNSPKWLDLVTDHARRLSTLLSRLSPCEKESLSASLIHWVTILARPSLILADYAASENKQICSENIYERTFANTTFNEQRKRVFADPLRVHLEKAHTFSLSMFSFLTKKNTLNCLPAVKFALTNPQKSPQRFRWQDEISSRIESLSKGHENRIPCFTALLAGTGSGKTLGIVKCMTASSTGSATRFSLGLGLRSLTIQTAREYSLPKKEGGRIGFTKQDVCVLIGDRIAREEAEESFFEDESENEVGTSNSHDDRRILQEVNPLIQGREQVCQLVQNIIGISQQDRRAIETPILLATTDHLMSGADLLSGTDAGMLIRLASADLALDEIDNYDASSLPALVRLCFICGFFGRSLLIASATPSETVVHSLFSAWHLGLRTQYYKGDTCRIAFGSENPENCIAQEIAIHSNLNLDQFKDRYTQFLHKQIDWLDLQKTRRKADWLHLQPVSTSSNKREQAFGDILKAMHALHIENSFSYTENGETCKVSIGFVRFNTRKVSQSFAKWIWNEATLPPNTAVGLLSHHADYIKLDRILIERFLDNGLRRSSDTPIPPIMNTPEIKSFLEKNRGFKHYLLIVSTTSIQETGRDHDYDWAVLDPSHHRSVVQAAGRVFRHRPEYIAEKSNVAILSQPSQIWHRNEKPTKTLPRLAVRLAEPWSWPGLGTPPKLGLDPHLLLAGSYPKPRFGGKSDPTTERTVRILENLGVTLSQDTSREPKGYRDAESFLGNTFNEKIDARITLVRPSDFALSPVRYFSEGIESLYAWEIDGVNIEDKHSASLFGKKYNIPAESFIRRPFLKGHLIYLLKTSLRGGNKGSSIRLHNRGKREPNWVFIPLLEDKNQRRKLDSMDMMQNLKLGNTSVRVQRNDIKYPGRVLFPLDIGDIEEDLRQVTGNKAKFSNTQQDPLREALLNLDLAEYEKIYCSPDSDKKATYSRILGFCEEEG